MTLIILISTICCVWFANAVPNSQRYWDERYSLRNIASILRTGSLRPSFAFYPSLSHLPQAGLLAASQRRYRATGNKTFQVLKPNGQFTPMAYLVSRWTSVVYCIGSLLLVYLIGSSYFSREIGLLATALLATSPFFLKTASTYKPDALLMLTSLAAFYFAVRAAERGTLRTYLLAGTAVGLSAAGKQNGALSSIPLIAATALCYRDAKRWLWLAVAGLAAVLIFLILNPWPHLLPKYLSMGKYYLNWAAGEPPSSSPILVYAARLPFTSHWHGVVIGSVVWLGFLGLGAQSLRKKEGQPRHAASTLLVLFVAAFPLACSLVSGHPKANIFVPLFPFTALAASWALVRSWKFAEERLDRPARRLLFGFAVFGLVTVTLPRYLNHLFQGAIAETTQTTAAFWIEKHAGFLGHRTIVSESTSLGVGWKRFKRPILVPLELRSQRLSEMSSSTLDLADYEVFPRSSLNGPAGDFYRCRMNRLASEDVRTFEPKPFRRRGQPLVVLSHPWRIHGVSRKTAAPPSLAVRWRDHGQWWLLGKLHRRFRPRQVISLDVVLTPEQAVECELTLRGQKVQLHNYLRNRDRRSFMTPRMIVESRAMPIRFKCPNAGLLLPAPSVTVVRWLPRRRAPTAD